MRRIVSQPKGGGGVCPVSLRHWPVNPGFLSAQSWSCPLGHVFLWHLCWLPQGWPFTKDASPMELVSHMGPSWFVSGESLASSFHYSYFRIRGQRFFGGWLPDISASSRFSLASLFDSYWKMWQNSLCSWWLLEQAVAVHFHDILFRKNAKIRWGIKANPPL